MDFYSEREMADVEKTVLLTNLDSGISIQDLKFHFSQYGNIEHISIEGEQATIRFEDKQTAFDIVSIKYHLLNECKIIAEKKPLSIKFDAEDHQFLTDDYHYSSIREEQLAANTVDEQIRRTLGRLRLSDEDLSQRENIRSYFQNLFSQYFTYSDVYLFGSSSNGLGVIGCDVDLLLSLRTEKEDSVVPILPHARQKSKYNALFKIIKEKSRKLSWSELSLLSEHDIISLMGVIIREQDVICRAVEVIPAVKCPIVHFIYNGNPDLSCDLSFKNRMVVFKSSLIRLYTEIDSRVGPLLIIIRLWFVKAKLEMSKGNRFHSYCTSLLVLHYLQQRSPPVIPTVEELRQLECETQIVANVDCSFCRDLKKIPPCCNEESVTDLLKGFFIYYDKFNFPRLAIDSFTNEDDDENDDDDPPGTKKRRESDKDYSKLPPTLRSNNVRVKVNKCTWVGREATKGILGWIGTSIIDNEVKISTYLNKNIKRMYDYYYACIFDFNVECTPSNDIYINISTVDDTENSTGQIYMFLKSYIPDLVKKLISAGEYE